MTHFKLTKYSNCSFIPIKDFSDIVSKGLKPFSVVHLMDGSIYIILRKAYSFDDEENSNVWTYHLYDIHNNKKLELMFKEMKA